MSTLNNHYSSYPSGDIPIYLAYGFRPIFLLLAPYMIISIILWPLVFLGFISLPISDILSWHIYEMIFGVGSAMIVAFFLTGLPELFSNVKPIVGKKLLYIVALWGFGRLSFWFIDYVGVFTVFVLNVSLTSLICYLITFFAFKDRNKKHTSLAYCMLAILFVQILYFLSLVEVVKINSLEILFLSLGFFLVLILLALRRISMESINQLLEQEKIDEIFVAKSYRYNLAIFCTLLYSFVEFFYPNNSALAYISFACFCSYLALINDFILKENNILFKTFVLYLILAITITAFGYFFIGLNYYLQLNYLNHFRHFLTTGTFGMVFYIVMIIISTIHTGRAIFTNFLLNLGLFLIIASTLIRVFIPYYLEYSILAYIISSILWAFAFLIYMKTFFPFLLSPRYDGKKG